MGINVAGDNGGSELDALAYAIAMEEISRGCARYVRDENAETFNFTFFPFD